MAKYHLSTDGNPRVCTAAEGNCPLGGDAPHFPSKDEARAAFEASGKAFPSPQTKNVLKTLTRITDEYYPNRMSVDFDAEGNVVAISELGNLLGGAPSRWSFATPGITNERWTLEDVQSEMEFQDYQRDAIF